jgi:hypothetical protein
MLSAQAQLNKNPRHGDHVTDAETVERIMRLEQESQEINRNLRTLLETTQKHRDAMIILAQQMLELGNLVFDGMVLEDDDRTSAASELVS